MLCWLSTILLRNISVFKMLIISYRAKPENYLKKDFIKVKRFSKDPNLPKNTTSFSEIDRHIQPSLLHATGLCLIF